MPVQKDFDKILHERDVVSALNDLDGLIKDASARKEAAETAAAASGEPLVVPTPYGLPLSHSIMPDSVVRIPSLPNSCLHSTSHPSFPLRKPS